MGGGDANANPRLRAALDKALEANMTKDVIDRAIKRGAGGMEGENVEEIRYEGYGPGGIAVMVDCMTNNRNRQWQKCGMHLPKMVESWHGWFGRLFFQKTRTNTFAPGVDEERLMELALELGAEDIIVNDDKSIDVITAPEDF